jgi:hypothetical protein
MASLKTSVALYESSNINTLDLLNIVITKRFVTIFFVIIKCITFTVEMIFNTKTDEKSF